MTTNDYNKAVASVIKLIVANNAGKVAQGLRSAGYETKDFVPASELETALFQLHSANPNKFYEVLSGIQWNYGNNNWTNEPKYRDEIMKLVGEQSGSAVAKGSWWEILLTLLQPQAPPPQPLPVSQGRGAGFWIGMSAIAIGIVVVIIIGIKLIK